MKCSECRGACCEEVVVDVPDKFHTEWALARGTLLTSGQYAFESRCPKLTACGECSIHTTSKPIVCVLYEAGGIDCLEVVRRRRTAADYQRIRDEGDPLGL